MSDQTWWVNQKVLIVHQEQNIIENPKDVNQLPERPSDVKSNIKKSPNIYYDDLEPNQELGWDYDPDHYYIWLMFANMHAAKHYQNKIWNQQIIVNFIKQNKEKVLFGLDEADKKQLKKLLDMVE